MRQIDRKDLLAQLLPVARTAGDAIMAIYRRGSADVSHKADASPVTEADLASHRAHTWPTCCLVAKLFLKKTPRRWFTVKAQDVSG